MRALRSVSRESVLTSKSASAPSGTDGPETTFAPSLGASALTAIVRLPPSPQKRLPKMRHPSGAAMLTLPSLEISILAWGTGSSDEAVADEPRESGISNDE